MYPEEMIIPMRRELTEIGFQELKTPEEVEELIQKGQTSLLIINSVCGCAAANARPAVKISLENDKKPLYAATVFAGVDTQATNKLREYLLPFPPSSPCIALFKNKKLVHMLERHHIEGRPADIIAENLMEAYNKHC